MIACFLTYIATKIFKKNDLANYKDPQLLITLQCIGDLHAQLAYRESSFLPQ